MAIDAQLAIRGVAAVVFAGLERQVIGDLLARQTGEHELGRVGRVFGILTKQSSTILDLLVVKGVGVGHALASELGIANAGFGRARIGDPAAQTHGRESKAGQRSQQRSARA
jgi:hypothetical protein